VVGLYGGELVFPLPYIPMRALTIQGSYTGSLSELKELMEIARRGLIPPMPVTPQKMQDVNMVLQKLRAGQILGRSILIPG
jgi:D-arabinose 1-dehydrogenase-like Zn-dependent alcohol dehydrogenase